MNLAKLIAADISVCLKVRATQVWLDRGTLFIIISVGWHGHVNAATENYLILRLHRPSQHGGDAELCFKRKIIFGTSKGEWKHLFSRWLQR